MLSSRLIGDFRKQTKYPRLVKFQMRNQFIRMMRIDPMLPPFSFEVDGDNADKMTMLNTRNYAARIVTKR
jgi:hypothetical protein